MTINGHKFQRFIDFYLLHAPLKRHNFKWFVDNETRLTAKIALIYINACTLCTRVAHKFPRRNEKNNLQWSRFLLSKFTSQIYIRILTRDVILLVRISTSFTWNAIPRRYWFIRNVRSSEWRYFSMDTLFVVSVICGSARIATRRDFLFYLWCKGAKQPRCRSNMTLARINR